MPTEGQFQRAAALLDDASVRSRSIMGPVSAAMGPEVLSGGALTASVEQLIEDSDIDAGALSRELADLAEECRSRAAAVAAAAAAAADHAAAVTQHGVDSRRYDADLAAHEADRSQPHPGQPPRRPGQAPTAPPWADF